MMAAQYCSRAWLLADALSSGKASEARTWGPTLVSGSNPSQPAKLARRIENHPEKYYALDPLRQSSKDGLWVAQREPLGTKLIPALIENSGNAGKGP